jgi:hypothetical protein
MLWYFKVWFEHWFQVIWVSPKVLIGPPTLNLILQHMVYVIKCKILSLEWVFFVLGIIPQTMSQVLFFD